MCYDQNEEMKQEKDDSLEQKTVRGHNINTIKRKHVLESQSEKALDTYGSGIVLINNEQNSDRKYASKQCKTCTWCNKLTKLCNYM